MTHPLVTAVMLTRDRQNMAALALQCFQNQTYPNKRLVILDTGNQPYIEEPQRIHKSFWKWMQHSGFAIGTLRNMANALADPETEILIHWDDDDWSHPNRMAEQVQLIQDSGADVVGYRECLFWREPDLLDDVPDVIRTHHPDRGFRERLNGAAWLHTHASPREAVGSSLCYWRKVWQGGPFQSTSQGEDTNFLIGKNVQSSSVFPRRNNRLIGMPELADSDTRMVCRIHGGNTSNAYRPEDMARAAEWQRVPAWDEYCRGVFA